MDEGKAESTVGGLLTRWSPRLLAGGAGLIGTAFAVLVLLDRALAGLPFLAQVCSPT